MLLELSTEADRATGEIHYDWGNGQGIIVTIYIYIYRYLGPLKQIQVG